MNYWIFIHISIYLRMPRPKNLQSFWCQSAVLWNDSTSDQMLWAISWLRTIWSSSCSMCTMRTMPFLGRSVPNQTGLTSHTRKLGPDPGNSKSTSICSSKKTLSSHLLWNLQKQIPTKKKSQAACHRTPGSTTLGDQHQQPDSRHVRKGYVGDQCSICLKRHSYVYVMCYSLNVNSEKCWNPIHVICFWFLKSIFHTLE